MGADNKIRIGLRNILLLLLVLFLAAMVINLGWEVGFDLTLLYRGFIFRHFH